MKTSTNPAFAQYISGFTSGSISAQGTIRIRLADQFVENVQLNVPIEDDYLSFSPSIDGELMWIDAQTLEFKPKDWLPRGQVYQAKFHLGKMVTVEDSLKEFLFGFTVLQQHIQVEMEKISAYSTDNLRSMFISGTVHTLDNEHPEDLEKVLTAKQGEQLLPIVWTHSTDPHIHHFTVDSIVRSETASEVKLQWNGEAVKSEEKGEIVQPIPALGDFKIIFTKVEQQPEQYIVVQYSDPLLPNQTFDGLIDLEEIDEERFTLDNNEIRIYPPYRLNGSYNLHIYPGIKNIAGIASSNEEILQFSFEELKPAVEMIDEAKNILPSTEGMVFAFRAVNLSAVDVRVIQIFENNVPQFLQVNELNGDYEMQRVGRQVAKKTVQLSEAQGKNLAQWNTFFLNLDDVIKAEPGAIYRIELSFKKSYSLYPCDTSDAAEGEEEEATTLTSPDDEISTDEFSYWDYYSEYGSDGYYEEDYSDYNWQDAENPCKSSFYKNRKPVGKNILASDLGIIAKKGKDKSMSVFINDLRTAQALSGVTVEILNFQQQTLAQATTDGNGEAKLNNVQGTPFLLVAKKEKQRGYLKLNDSYALSVSTFEVSGSAPEKGLKGFIYGERGVWRPGDSLFVSFILEDKEKTLPQGHPVSFELVNPRGRSIHKSIKTKGTNGFYNFTCVTDADAETGNYLATVRVGGATFTKTLKIETIKPNRLKLALDFGKEKISVLDKELKGNLSAQWLHGAKAGGLKANVTVSFTPLATVFDAYKDYQFDDPTASFAAEEQVIYDTNLNSEGQGTVGMNIDLASRAPGFLNANFNVKVTEEGGDFSVDRFSIPYAPYDHFVGLKTPKGDAERGMLLTDTDQRIEIVTLNAQGKPAKRDGIQWQVYKVEWRWWWEQNSNDLIQYSGESGMTPIAEGSFGTGADGKGNFKFQIKYPEWGRYLIRVIDPVSGHATGKAVYVDWPGWAGKARTENPGGSSMLMVTTDKTKYAIGEKCTVQFASTEGARALVSLENGTRVIESKWISTSKERTSYTFSTNEKMAPNAYVHITLIQPHAQTANDLPIRMYGIVPLFVENPASHLEPVITMKNELEPEKTFDVTVSEKTGRGMSYTIAIVDEGLLDLTRFKTPDPWNYFYAKEALGVNTFDIYDQVIGAFGSRLEKLLSLGGSDEGLGKGKNRANRFKPVVMYAGPFTAEPGQNKKHTFTMPNYVGSVKVMVVAGKDFAYGNAEKVVPVKKPLMVLATLPRVLGPEEEVLLPVTVFAMDKSIKTVDVKVETNELVERIGSASQKVNFATTGDQIVYYSLKVKGKEGVGKVKVNVSSGSFKSSYEVELDIRNPNPDETNTLEATVEGGQTWSTAFDLLGLSGTQKATLEVSSIPAIQFGKRMKYLLQYPHGCVEQTTSAAFPQLFVNDLMETGEKEKTRADQNIKAAITRLVRFQIANGGLAYWPGATEADDWGTTYAGHFLLEAKAKGYTIPSAFENKWLDYQKKSAQQWQSSSASSTNDPYGQNALMQAYRLYTLALAGKAEMGAMNRLKETKNLSDACKWRLAAAYVLAGQKNTATQIIKDAKTKVTAYTDAGDTYGSEYRDYAMIVETLSLLNDRTKAAPLVKKISAQLSSTTWLSTQTTAYGLLAIAKYSGGASGKSIKYNYTLNGKQSGDQFSQKPLKLDELTAKETGNKLELKNTTGHLLYVRLILSGKPKNGSETASEQGLAMKVDYTDLQGKPIAIGRLTQGTDFYAVVTVEHKSLLNHLDNLALSQVFPSGWEISTSRLNEATATTDAADYQDIRDDRVYSYFSLLAKKSKTFRIKLNAAYLGKFYLPSVSCEAMYNASIHARTKGQWVEVVEEGRLASKK